VVPAPLYVESDEVQSEGLALGSKQLAGHLLEFVPISRLMGMKSILTN
jgi:hypothetical protein